MRRSPTPYESLMKDTAVFDEIRESVSTMKKKLPVVEAQIKTANEMSFYGKAFSLDRRAIVNYMDEMPNSEARIDSPDRISEAIVLFQGRPAILIQNGVFQDAGSQTWNDRLSPHKAKLKKVIPSVGRVELVNHADFSWVGTAWVIDEKVLITNRHVASVFAKKQGSRFVIVQNSFGQDVTAKVDFREEYQVSEAFEVEVENVLFMAEANGPDAAFLLLKDHAKLPDPITLAARDASQHDPVAVLGYPALDTRNDGPIMSRIFADVFDVKRMAPGEVSFVESGKNIFEHDCSTLGGNSGSPVINYETGEAVGLHFSGRFGVANFAVKASAVKQLLTRVSPTSVSVTGDPDERRTAADYDDREGFQEGFLGTQAKFKVPFPELGDLEEDAVTVAPRGRGIDRFALHYTHFSVVMCKSRRSAFYTAVNIDGSADVTIRRRNTTWLLDPRIPKDDQIGNEFYASNKIDRGHLVRRNDPVWGSSAEAAQAENDTFHYTNAAPQHQDLNQKEWLKLEDHLLNNANARDLKISVFTGPIFSESDIEYREVQIPEQFWKVVAMVAPGGTLHATAYLLSQRQFLDDLEFVFGKFRTYQTSIAKIEELTGLSFGKLSQHDPLNGTESVGGGQPMMLIEGMDSIVL